MRTLVLLCSVLSIINAKNIDLSSSDNVSWSFVNKNKTITGPATVPGGVYSDLLSAGIIGDILTGYNDVLTRWVAYDIWTYTTKFNVTNEDLEASVIHLVFEGLDTSAFIMLNEHNPIGSVNNMFVRYVFDIKEKLQAGQNELKVTFLSPITTAATRSNKVFAAPNCVPSVYNGECHVNQIRKMQASFGWDWGPAFPSVGIWKPVYIELYNTAIIRTVTTHTDKLGSNWQLRIRAHLETSKKVTQITGVLSVSLQAEGNQTIKIWKNVSATSAGDGTLAVDIDVTISENKVRTWWPNGYGEQPLYDLHVDFTDDDNTEAASHKFLRIGFRTVELVETEASTIFGNATAGKGLTFFFKVNGYPLFMKGSNWIPSHILPELGETQKDMDNGPEAFMRESDSHLAGFLISMVWQTNSQFIHLILDNCGHCGSWKSAVNSKQTTAGVSSPTIFPGLGPARKPVLKKIIGLYLLLVDHLLHSARDVNMAMLRVWGGGVYESDYFYDKCDELGILIWQDFLFACSMYPTDVEFISAVEEEIEQNVLRLQHHPSITVWAGNNENEVALRGNWYDTSYKFSKYKEDYIKLYVDTIQTIVEDLDPGRRYLVSSPSNGRQSEKEGYIAANPYDPHYGDTHYYNYLADNWNMNTYPKTRFASEYGFQSLPSLKTMKNATKNPEDFHVHSKYSEHRQHSPNGYSYIEQQLRSHLKLDLDDPKYFQKFVFYSQISQAMAMKAETEVYRQDQANWYTMGALYWQLNDVWQAPSWSGIEYGGKWKMLHYFAKSFFAPVLVSPRLRMYDDIEIYLINDRLIPITDAQIIVDIYKWNSMAPVSKMQFNGSVEALSSKLQDIDIGQLDYIKQEIFMRFSLQAPGISSSPYNYIFPVPLKSTVGLKTPNIQISVANIVTRRQEKLEYTIDIHVDTIVLFLWLETDIAGHFDDNGMIVTEPQSSVRFLCSKYVPPRELQRSIHHQYYEN